MSLSFDDFAHGRDPLIEFAKTIDQKLVLELYGTSGFETWSRPSQRVALESSSCATPAD